MPCVLAPVLQLWGLHHPGRPSQPLACRPRRLCWERSRRRRAHTHAAAAPAAAPAETVETGSGGSVNGTRYAPGQLERETLRTLDWPAVCAQVAAFTSTPVGDAVLRAGLHLGTSRAESELLLRLTAQAGALEGQLVQHLRDVHDVRHNLSAVTATPDAALPGDALVRIGTTLSAAAALADALRHAAPGGTALDLVALAGPLAAPPHELGDVLLRSLSVPGGTILDAASPELADVRARRRDTAQRLRSVLQSTATKLVAQGAADAAQVVSRRNRLCVPIRRGMTALLPGCVVLDQSFSGATLFVEPPEGTALNNDAAALDARHEELEQAVLKALSAQVAAHAPALNACITALVAVDAAIARARHGAWLGATALPVFSTAAGDSGATEVLVLQARHPLLLGAALPAPPMRWWELEAARAAAEAAARAALPGREPAAADTSDASAADGPEGAPPARPAPPVPVDWRVGGGARCVVITGANTGGKTASIKTLALCCLLARAGCFVAAAGGDAQRPPPRVPWVASVLADMGDGQSLSSGLSTFGGHVARLAAILRSCRPRGRAGDTATLSSSASSASSSASSSSSAAAAAAAAAAPDDEVTLVLLDEPGAGTDPDEGAALACALLTTLATCNALTVATSHYDSVKRMAEQPQLDGGAGAGWCVNAAVEFDEASLRPTYRLLWNATGKSYAVNAAIRAGLPRRVIDTAVALMRRGEPSGGGGAEAPMSLNSTGALADTLAAQLREATRDAQAAEQARIAAEKEADALSQRAEALKKGLKALIAAAEADARAAEAAATAAFASVPSAPDPGAAWEAALAEHLPPGWEYVGGSSGAVRRMRRDGDADAGQAGTTWTPAVGALVRVAALSAKRLATVMAVSDDVVTVRMGTLTSHVPRADVRPADDGAAALVDDEQDDQAASRITRVMPKVSRASAARHEAEFLTPRAASAGDAMAMMAVVPSSQDTTIDVRGMYATEAVAAVEAAVQARGRVRGASIMHVVHGVGTGRVKTAVTDFLRGCPLVARMEQAAPRDGGAGCTVVFLR